MNNSTPAVLRSIEIIELLARSGTGVTMAELSRELGIPRATVFRICKTLESASYLQRVDANGRYWLGSRLASLGALVLENFDVRRIAQPHLEALMRQTGETAQMAALEGNAAIFLSVADGPSPLLILSRPGYQTEALHKSAVGRVFLAHFHEDRLKSYLQSDIFRSQRGGAKYISELKASLAQTRRRGYCFQPKEENVELARVAAPVLDIEDQATFAVAVVYPSFKKKTRTEIRRLCELVVRTAGKISAELKGLASKQTETTNFHE